MIHDRLENAAMYSGLSERFRKAFAWLSGQGKEGLAALAEGRIAIDGEDVYALVQAYETEAREKRSYETHRRYADIQVVLAGRETIVYRQAGQETAGRGTGPAPLEATSDYNEVKDMAGWRLDGGIDVVLEAGEFAVFFPQDAHAPKVASPTPSPVRKVVVKVRVQA
jgi:YhcH/YjgK/YiaL family protein